MSVKGSSCPPVPPGGVVRAGYLKKLKTFKKKYFVLRSEAPEASARLEYYDSEKKYAAGQPPKRSIPLKTCFNINRRVDTKHKHVIALYTKDDCFCVVLDTEEELETWLKALLSLQQGDDAADGETPRPTFEHVWQVTVLNRGLGGSSVLGAHNKGQDSSVFRLCLTDRTLSLIRKDRETPQAELTLSSIRGCGSLKNYFYLEAGRSSITGAGELWMETEDANIAQNVKQTVYHAMTNNSSSKEELGPKIRNRSSSATESSKPMTRRQTGTSKYHLTQGTGGGGRERCDSMPSRARTSSEGTHPIPNWAQPRTYLAPHRPQSLYVREISHSPPAESPVSPPSAACSTDSAGSSLSIDDPDQCPETDTILGRYGHSLTPDEAIAEENYDECPDSPCLPQSTSPSGYLPMAPLSSDDGYVDMSPRGRHINMSPAASTSSITSGTPSTDMRFAEYPLEKVSAYFTPSEEETSSVDRPIRAYSVGSRPETYKNKNRIEISTLENARVRAFSVGAKTRKLHTRVLPPHGTHIHPKPKSSSAPLLSGSRTLISHDDPMNDLMEMDFSRPPNSNYGYMDTNPTNKAPDGYMEMRPGFHDVVHVPEVSPYMDMRCSSSPVKPSYMPVHEEVVVHPGVRINSEEYVDMDPGKTSRNYRSNTRAQDYKTPTAGSPVVARFWRQADYMDMNFHPGHKNTKPDLPTMLSSSPKYPDESPMDGSLDYMDMGFKANSGRTALEVKPGATDGYVEMSLGKGSHQRQSSLDSNRISSDSTEDYTNMSVGSNRKKEKRGSRKDKTRSQPIQIQTTAASQFIKGSSSISPVYSSLHIGRKYSTGTPPKMYLPLSTSGSDSYSSLPRQRSRKNSRRDSKDSSSSSVTTPSSSSTIFPISLNSPSSPLKPCSVKSPEVSSNIKIPVAIINVKYNRPSFSQDKSQSDYTLMDLEKSKATSDYVNYNPSVPIQRQEAAGDYAVMRPGTVEVSRLSEPKVVTPISSPSTLTTQMSSITLSKSDLSGARCFIPISEGKEEPRLGTGSPKPGDLAPSAEKSIEALESEQECLSPVAKISRPNSVNSESVVKARPSSVSSELKGSLSRPSSASSELGSSSSTLVGSRPASVNSDRIRPASVNIEGQLHYASLDLAPANEDEGNRSPRSVKCAEVSNSSPTQTLPPESGTGFTYAEIDFVKSEGFKHNALPSNAKVKH